MTFCAWFLSLGMVLRFIHIVAHCISTAFLFMAEKYFIVCLYHNLFIHSYMGGYFWVVSNLLATVIHASLTICVQGFVWVPRTIELLIIHWLASWRTVALFPTVIAPFYILTSNVWGFQCLYILANTYFPLKKIIVILLGVKCYFMWFCFFISLMMLSMFSSTCILS